VIEDFRVVQVQYDFSPSVKALSDHALVIADLAVPAT
jgi:hypothetical protein